MNSFVRKRSEMVALSAVLASVVTERNTHRQSSSNVAERYCNAALCEAAARNSGSEPAKALARPPSWIRRSVLAPIGIPLPIPRILTPSDPALKLPRSHLKRRTRDEERLRKIIQERGPSARADPEKAKELAEEIFEVMYGKGVTPQAREDFLVRYGCTGWTEEVLDAIVDLCRSRGIVEIGAGHGQWARALAEAYAKRCAGEGDGIRRKNQFDFVLAYDDMSDLPLNTKIYHSLTQPHHDYFGDVRELKGKEDGTKVLRSWACRGRALLLVYPPPGPMAIDVVRQYTGAAPENDTIIFVGEGRGGANGNDELFDFLESGEWALCTVLPVLSQPGDKGYEKLFVLKRASNK